MPTSTVHCIDLLSKAIMEAHAFATQDAMFSPLASYRIFRCADFGMLYFQWNIINSITIVWMSVYCVCMLYSVLLYSLYRHILQNKNCIFGKHN